MNLLKYDNFWNDPFADVDQWFDRAFDMSRWPNLRNHLPNNSSQKSLRVDVYDDEDNYYVLSELPGVDKKDIEIQLENAVLTISGERKYRMNNEESSSKFTRSITVADDINGNNVAAKLEEGLLKITLPKAEERKPKAITVS